MPGRKKGTTWYVEPDAAEEWLAQHSPRTVAREKGPKVRAQRPRKGPRADPAPTTPPADQGEAIDQHIIRLDQILAAFISTLHDGEFDARAVTGIKQVSAELRMLERHRLEMRERENRLVPMDRHQQIMATLSRIVVEEIQAFAPRLPERIVTTLTEAGIKVNERMMRLMAAQAEGQTDILRTRIADAIEAVDS